MYKYDKGKYVKTDDTDQTVGVNNSLVRSANVNSNENSTVSAASLTKSGSSDEFELGPAMKQRILAAKDRQNMRQQATARRLAGGSERIESQYLKQPDTQETYINRRGKEKKSKLYKHNLNVQERINKGLDKKNLQPTGFPGPNNMSAKQAADEERFSNIAKQLPKPIDLSESVKDTRLLIDEPVKKRFLHKGKVVDGVSIGRGFDKSTVSSSSFNRAGKFNTAESYKFIKSEKPGKTVFNYANTKDYKPGQEAKPGIENISFDINKYK